MSDVIAPTPANSAAGRRYYRAWTQEKILFLTISFLKLSRHNSIRDRKPPIINIYSDKKNISIACLQHVLIGYRGGNDGDGQTSPPEHPIKWREKWQ
jgi:hypothetical protein